MAKIVKMSAMIKPPTRQTVATDPQSPLDAVVSRAQARRAGILGWLNREHPEVFEEQLHIRSGTSERAYWHHGYMMALADVLRALGASDDDAERTAAAN